MNPRDRMIALMEGRQVPQQDAVTAKTPTITAFQDYATEFEDFGALQTDSPQVLQADRVSNPRFNAPGAFNGAERMMTIQVPISIGMAWESLLKQHNLSHEVELGEALTNHLLSLESNGFQPSDA